MTELDFDELDKAVNDLMQDTPTAQSLSQSGPPQLPSSPAQSSDDPQASTPVSAMPLAVKRRGRFMDVMAPANAKKPVADTMIKRQGITISTPTDEPAEQEQPQKEVEQQAEDTSIVEPVDVAPAYGQASEAEVEYSEPGDTTPAETEQELTPTDTGDYSEHPAPVAEWPEDTEDENAATDTSEDSENTENPTNDSAMFSVEAEGSIAQPNNDETNESQGAATPDNADETEDVDATDQPEVVADDSEQLTTVIAPDEPAQANESTESSAAVSPEPAMVSPFLPDTKVEKRPLGGSDQPSDGVVVDSTPGAVDLPREYSTELMNLETSTSPTNGVQAEKQEPVKATAPGAESDMNAQLAATVAVPLAATGSASAGTIFDTDTYHTALKNPEKKQSIWLVIVWLLVLLMIGAVAGAAYYYYTTQR